MQYKNLIKKKTHAINERNISKILPESLDPTTLRAKLKTKIQI